MPYAYGDYIHATHDYIPIIRIEKNDKLLSKHVVFLCLVLKVATNYF